MKINPFIFARPLQPEEFTGRESYRNQVLSNLLTFQSSVLVGDPHIGKTSLLNYIRDVAQQQPDFRHYLFSFLDAHTLGSGFTSEEFWKRELDPLRNRLGGHAAFLAETFHTAEQNQFGTYVLEKLFKELGRHGWKYVLIIDELDALMKHDVLNSAEFWGGLRSISSRYKGLILLTASRKTNTQLNQMTAEFCSGSPYFNTFDEIRLLPLSEEVSRALLQRAEDTFIEHDYCYIMAIAGGHPYLLQVAASITWKMYQDQLRNADLFNPYEKIGWEFYRAVEFHFTDT